MNEVQAAQALGALSHLGPRTELAAARALADLGKARQAAAQPASR